MKWKIIPGHEVYEASTSGDVRHRKTKHVLSGSHKTTNGYPLRRLWCNRDGKWVRRTFALHSLVLMAFRGPRPSGATASHLDGNKENGRLSNLVYESQSKNLARRRKHGTMPDGEKHPCSKLTCNDVATIRQMIYDARMGKPGAMYFTQIAKSYGVSLATIRQCAYRTWRNVPMPPHIKKQCEEMTPISGVYRGRGPSPLRGTRIAKRFVVQEQGRLAV